MTDAFPPDVQILERQLERMRGMLGAYSQLFFSHMRTWALATVGLLVVSQLEPLRVTVTIVPFLVPFVFLEASYLFLHTLFARRHAAFLEVVIGQRLGQPVLHAHTIEAAWYQDPGAPKVSAFSVARPLGHVSAMTAGYTVMAVAAWIAGFLLTAEELAGAGGAAALILPAALAWTAAVIVYLLWTWLTRQDESRLEAALRAAYPGVDPGP